MKRLLPILAILWLAAATRIINSSSWPPWTDEGWSIYAASDHHIDVILSREITQDRHPPLYFLSLSAWETVAGDSRLALRFLSIAAGLLTVALTYRIGADWFGQRAALYAALLLAVLHIAVYYSQEIRDYGWLALSVTLMTFLFARYLYRPRRSLLIAYVLSIVFMLYTLSFGILVLVIHGFVGVFLWRASRRQKVVLIGGWLVAALLYIPWIVVLLEQSQRLSAGIGKSLPTSLDGMWQAAYLILSDAAIPLLCLYALALWYTIKRSNYRTARLTIVLCGIGVFVLLFGINLKAGSIAPRTLSFFTPMLMILCGYGLSLIGIRLALAAATALTGYFLVTHPSIRPRLSSDHVADALSAHYAPGDLIVLENGWDDNALRYEIIQKLGHSVDPELIVTLPWENDYVPKQPVVPQIEGDLRAHRRVWLVNWLVYSQVGQYLDGGGTGYRRVLGYQVPIGPEYAALYPDPNVRVTLYEKPPVAGATVGQQFGDTLWLRDTVYEETVQRGHVAQIDFWWSALKAPPQDYTVVAFMLDTHDTLRVRDDHMPDPATSQWNVGDQHFDRHSLLIPADLPLGTYQLAVKVYLTDRNWLPVNGNEYVVIGAIRVVE